MDSQSITDTVVDAFKIEDKRLATLVHGAVRHLHDYVREVQLTHAEWRACLTFLTKSAEMTSNGRNEFSLLSDIFGVSSLVDLLHSSADATPGSVLGPFHVHDSHTQDNGVDLMNGQAGEATYFHGQVLSSSGKPIRAEIDFWQNADNGLYPQQDSAQDAHNLRCKLWTDDDGQFAIRTLKPRPYSVPDDGPVGDLLRISARHCMRAAHFHVIVSADGYRPLVTEIFPSDDPYLETDAVFGVRPALRVDFVEKDDPERASMLSIPNPFLDVRFDFRLRPLAG
ncbi:MAG: dioxygenase [Pseudomonadota bacterium]